MILRKPMLRAVVVLAIVAPERKIDFHPALLASQTVRLLAS
jgi:hypothetical protein